MSEPTLSNAQFDAEVILSPKRNRSEINPRARKFLQVYERTSWTDPVLAAKEAGFTHPVAAGKRMIRRYAKFIERDKERLWSRLGMTSAEVQVVLAEVARGNRDATPQQVRALEIIARIHGLLSEKLNITVDRRVLENNLIEIGERLAKKGHLLPSKAVD